MGHELKVNFYSPRRTLKLATKVGGKYLGMLPVYADQTIQLIFSSPVPPVQLAWWK